MTMVEQQLAVLKLWSTDYERIFPDKPQPSGLILITNPPSVQARDKAGNILNTVSWAR